MLPDIENLIAVQQADREIARLKAEIAELPKRVAKIEEKLAGTRANLEQARAAIKADEAARRKFETAIQDLQGKISKYRDQSLEVKTNDQYKALMHEVQFAEQNIRGNEDKILELMEHSESREKDVKAAELELKEETDEIEREKAAARERTAEDEKQLTEWNAKREAARSAVNADLLRQYERVAKYRGSGLAEVLDQKCMGCQVMLRPQTYNEIRAGTLLACDSCQRILYFDPSHEKPAAAPAVAAHRKRPRPKFEAGHAWYFHPQHGEDGEVFLNFMNSDGRSSRRVYDAASGRRIGDIRVREGEYRLGFPEDLTDLVIRLNGKWPETEIDAWDDELPTVVLDYLHRDLALARSESAPRSRPQTADSQAAS